MERLQAGGSALSITPVGLSEIKMSEDAEDILNSPSALSITPIWRNSGVCLIYCLLWYLTFFYCAFQ